MKPRRDAPATLAAYGMLTLTMLFWAGNHIVGRWASGNIPPITLTFLRWTGAALLIAPFAWQDLRRDLPIIRQNLKILLLLAITGSGLFNTLQYIALDDTSASNAAIINSAAPSLIVVMSFLINREPISTRQIIGIMISTLGVLCVMSKGTLETFINFSVRNGDIIMLVAITLWAFYSVLLARRPNISLLTFAFFTYAIAALLNGALAFIEIAQGASVRWSPETAAAILYTATFPSLIAYMFYNRGVEILGANRAGPTIHLVPVFTILLAVTFLDEHFRAHHAIGLALIFLGIYFATLSQYTKRNSQKAGHDA